MAAGLIGVPLGSALAQKLRVYWQQGDPLICAIGLLISAPLLFFAMITANTNLTLCYILIFCGQVSLNLNWSIVADMLLVSDTCTFVVASVYISDNLYFHINVIMFHSISLQYVVIPTRRSTAEAFQILIAHTFGDAGSPYLIGLVCMM